jgi:hypothetical protein
MTTVKYSKYGLINQELMALDEDTFFGRLLNAFLKDKRLAFEIMVPNDLYFRADVLCDDILQKRKNDKEYTQSELVQHVFFDFLDEVRDHDGNVGAIYTKLDVRRQEILRVNENPLVPSRSRKKLLIKIDRDDALRAEVLLQDLEYFQPNHNLDVEKLIEIVYLDFLLEYTKGRRRNVIKEILEYID